MDNNTLFCALWLVPAFISCCMAIGAIKDDKPFWGMGLCAIAVVPFASLIVLAALFLYGICMFIAEITKQPATTAKGGIEYGKPRI